MKSLLIINPLTLSIKEVYEKNLMNLKDHLENQFNTPKFYFIFIILKEKFPKFSEILLNYHISVNYKLKFKFFH